MSGFSGKGQVRQLHFFPYPIALADYAPNAPRIFVLQGVFFNGRGVGSLCSVRLHEILLPPSNSWITMLMCNICL